MDYNNFRMKIYYIDMKKLLSYILISLIFFSMHQIALMYDFMAINDIVQIFKIIIVMILLMFTIHLKNLTKKDIYGILQIFLFTICIVFMVFLTPENQFQGIKIFLTKLGYSKCDEFQIINTVMLYYIIAKYKNVTVVGKKIYLEYIALFGIISFFSLTNNVIDKNFIYLLYIISTIVLLIGTYRYININNESFNKKIDLLKLNINIMMIYFFIRIFVKYTDTYFLVDIVMMIKMLVYTATILFIIVNISKENYNFMFKETVNTNKKLEEINKEIIQSNYKLEEAYRKLKERQLVYKSFLGCLPDPIVIVNNNLRISYCNSNFLNLIEKENLREVVNRRIENYINFDVDIRKKVVDINKGSYSTTIDKDDKKIEVRFFSLNGEESECILLLKDLTEEIKLVSMKEELESIKMKEEIKRNFLSSISHDLKIPISVIYSAIQLEKILIENNDIEKINFYNEVSKQNCFMLTKFTNNLIDTSKIDSENLDANLVLDNIVEFVEDYINSLFAHIKSNGINILFDTDEEEIYVYFDKEMMERVILNLISNSLKFTDEDGTIFINIKNSKDAVLIEVGDTGIGMSKEFIKKAFNKYEVEDRIKNNNSTGFGVGLFVVYNLIKAQNGDIEIISDVGKGTTFIIKLYK
ncbi:HAMP domain-containing histidine kinase [Clostridium sp. DSM 100503]|uniref:sensor histidine kinase n=1 Tax=Clostridium sp. DSM 100503 TaxID=2963282 RepID=UPI002149F41C|nr:HAMP domain-containing sensor histidine kinase [Clostridium sp. DSM 100503]MCR1949495.1 HAMP domain-containing histidine kinase [Clostridium sp. DSM 100503]